MTHDPIDKIPVGCGNFIPLEKRAQFRRNTHRLLASALGFMLTITMGLTDVFAQQEEDGVNRPSLEELANGDRPRGNGHASEPIYIDFEDVSLLDVISAIGLKTGRNFEVDPNLANQKVTIISHHPVPAELAYDILESILSSRNFVMMETLDGNLIKIMPRAGTQGNDKLQIYKGSIPPIDGFDRFSIHVVEVQFADATEVAELLKRVGSGNDEITVYQQTNLLVIKDTADGVRNMMTLLEVIDVPGTGSSVEIFTLEFTRAEALAQQIEEVLLGDESSGGQRSGASQRAATTAVARRNPRTAAVPGQANAEIIGQGEETLRMVSDERLNALIVVASEGLMDQVRFLIGQLDTPTPFEANNMHYIELLNADAEAVVEALDAITGTAPRQGNTQGGAQSGEVQPFEKDIVIASYEQTNALLILATPQDFKLLKNMIDHLDVPRRQVNVEAVIMQVLITDVSSLSVELAGLTDDDAFGLSNAVSIANVLTGGVSGLGGAGAVIGIIDGTTTVPDLFSEAGGSLTVPNIPLLLRAMEMITDVEVLSRPNLLAVDNTAAEITVGQEIPIINSLSDTDDRTGFQSRSQVSRRDVGVRLSVTPQINEGDYVSMEVEVEVSAAVDATVGISQESQGGATIDQSLVRNEVVVGDGQTGIIGGLIRESSTGSVRQVPLLGDIPLFGWLFRGKSKTRDKQNLVVLITPHVIKRGEDSRRITEHRVNEFYEKNLDAVFEEGGLIKKVKAKRKQRNQRLRGYVF